MQGREAKETPGLPTWLKELGVAAAIFGLVFWLGQGMRGGGEQLDKAQTAPAFELEDMRSFQRVTREDLLGTPVALSFWGTWCGACRKELPALESLHRASNGAYKVVTIANDPPQKLARFIERNPSLSLPMLVDPPGRVHRAYGIRAVPTTVVIDSQGSVVEIFTGASSTEAIGRKLLALAR